MGEAGSAAEHDREDDQPVPVGQRLVGIEEAGVAHREHMLVIRESDGGESLADHHPIRQGQVEGFPASRQM